MYLHFLSFHAKKDQMTKDDKNEKQVVSKQRVADHGEVYTAKREVNAMLDLVKEETERIVCIGGTPKINLNTTLHLHRPSVRCMVLNCCLTM